MEYERYYIYMSDFECLLGKGRAVACNSRYTSKNFEEKMETDFNLNFLLKYSKTF